MYVHPCDVGHIVAWLNGVRAYEIFFGDPLSRVHWLELRRRAIEARGWSDEARGCWVEMQERGLSPEQVIDELLLIEIAVLQSAQSVLAAGSISAS